MLTYFDRQDLNLQSWAQDLGGIIPPWIYIGKWYGLDDLLNRFYFIYRHKELLVTK